MSLSPGAALGGARCRSCGAAGAEVFYEARRIPVHSCLMLADERQALDFRTGDLALAFCRSCGFIGNARFDAGVHQYSTRYEETQSFSPRFNRFAGELASRLLDRWDLRGKTVLEIGCGKGEFLSLLCEVGGCRGIGFDPGYRPERNQSPAAARIRFVQDFWSEKYADVGADLICCRHTLEHIPDVAEFVALVRRTIGTRRDTLVFFELPDVHRVLDELAFWDVYYEHCSYFSIGSLARLFRASGFEILDLEKGFDDQYLLLVARPGAGAGGANLPAEDDLEALARSVDSFAQRCPASIRERRDELAAAAAQGRRVVLWGSGSKAVSYLTTLGVRDEIRHVVDINPHKWGMYLAGTGQRIVAPEFLAQYRPDRIVLMNPIYRAEVQADCARLGVQAELVSLEGR